MAIGELHQNALALLRHGDLAAAERAYGELLKEQPDDFLALHRLGCIAMQTGRQLEACGLLQRAVGLNSNSAAAHRNLGAVLTRLGRSREALASYDRALALESDCAQTHAARAAVLCALERFDQAVLGFDQAIALQPAWPRLHGARAATLGLAGRVEEALRGYDTALELDPGNAAAHRERGTLLLSLDRPDQALPNLERAAELEPDNGHVHINHASALRALRRNAEALASWDRALQVDPQCAAVYVGRGPALQDLERPEEALASCERAIALEPDCAAAHLNRGGALCDLNRLDEALASIERAVALDPGCSPARCNAGMLHLQLGRFASGWSLYEQRPDALAAAARPQPRWRGDESIVEKTLFVRAEQGFGDTIQFCRYAPLLEARGARVVLSVYAPLRRLMQGLSSTIQILGDGETPQEFDFHCPLLSLPLAFGTTLDTIPRMPHYLAAEPDRIARWRGRIGNRGFRIGICWQGNPHNAAEVGRSPPLAMFAPLAALPGVRLISLQKHHGTEQLAAMPPGMTVEELGEEFDAGPDAFLDAAAVMEGLDLIITSDTSIAHLAGALGRPTWVVLKHVPEWRWLVNREDSPWYPTLRLFRQSRRGDWEGVFADVRRALIDRCGGADR